MTTCPACGTETDQRVGVVIGGAWHYCWLCPKCGERWGWINERQSKGANNDNKTDISATCVPGTSVRLPDGPDADAEAAHAYAGAHGYAGTD